MAGTFTVQVEGLEQLQRKFSMSNRVVKREASDAMEKSVATLRARAAVYPAPPPASGYIRTGTLGRLWHHEVHQLADGVQGIVGNATPYAPYVKDDQAQAWMHQGRWPTVKDDVNAERDRIEGFFAKALENLAKFLGD